MQAASKATEEADSSAAAADQESQEIDIEGTGDTTADDVPMELTTPLSSGSELNLSFESELVDDKSHQDKLSASSEVATIKQDDETMDVDVVGEAGATTSSTPRTERVDSVQIDPSFKPESEELLYEGDVENDGEASKSVPADSQSAAAPATTTTTTTHEEGFVLAVDDTFATDLDEAHGSGKSPPKKDGSSKTKSDSKSSSKPSSSSAGSQSTLAKSEGSSSSATATTEGSSSKHQSKDAGKPTSSSSTETAPASRFV